MVSVLPATVACAVRTVAAGCLLGAGGVLAGRGVMPPPMAAAAARLMLAMMILGCRTVISLSGALPASFLSRRGCPAVVVSGWAGEPGPRRRAGRPPRRGWLPGRGPGPGPR